MKKFKNHTVQGYINILSQKTPVPGGGSAAALTAVTGSGLISMVARYSLKPNMAKKDAGKIHSILKKNEKIKASLLDCVDLDPQAYLKVVKARSADKRAQKAARREAGKIPLRVCKLCYEAMRLLPGLVKKGNPCLMSDIEVATELLTAAYNAAMINVKINK